MTATFPWRAALAATALYTAAFLLTTACHELGHALVSKAVGGQPVWHSTYVDTRTLHLPVGSELAIALAGPLLSLGQGLLLWPWAQRRRSGGNLALLRLYAMLFGFINFLGYLLTGPLVAYGDIGQAEALASVPTWAAIVLALAAAVGLHFLVASTGPLFLQFGASPTRQLRGRLMRALVALPWALGSVLVTAISWPLPTLLSVIYPPMSSMVLGAAWGGAMRLPYPAEPATAAAPLLAELRLGPALGLLLVVAVLLRLLAPGIAL